MIGIVDSGVGGLTVARAIMDHLPDYDIIYCGDTARAPYGAKSPETIRRYIPDLMEFILNQGAQLIIVACSAIAGAAEENLADTIDKPLFEITGPAVDMALKASKNKRIGVIGSRATIQSDIYTKKIKMQDSAVIVHSIPCPLLAPLVEEGWTKRPETRMIVKKYLHPLKTRQIDTLILGASHFPLLKKIIRPKIGKRVTLIDTAQTVAERVRSFVTSRPDIDRNLSKTKQHRFFISDVTAQLQTTAKSILKQNINLENAWF